MRLTGPLSTDLGFLAAFSSSLASSGKARALTRSCDALIANAAFSCSLSRHSVHSLFFFAMISLLFAHAMRLFVVARFATPRWHDPQSVNHCPIRRLPRAYKGHTPRPLPDRHADSLEHEARSGPWQVLERLPQNAVAFGPRVAGDPHRQLRRRTFDVCEVVSLGGYDIVRATLTPASPHGYAIKLRRNGRRCWSTGFVDDFFDVAFAGLARPTNIDGARWHPSEMAPRIGGLLATTISRSSPRNRRRASRESRRTLWGILAAGISRTIVCRYHS